MLELLGDLSRQKPRPSFSLTRAQECTGPREVVLSVRGGVACVQLGALQRFPSYLPLEIGVAPLESFRLPQSTGLEATKNL